MTTLAKLPCYLNGEYSDVSQAKVSVLDRGFIFGDGIYEVVPVYGGRLFCFDEHMARLSRSLAQVRIANPLSLDQWRAVALQLVAAYALFAGTAVQDGDQMVYIQVTRGVAMREHGFPQNATPTVFAMTNAMTPPSAQQRQRGVACITADDFRWKKADIKSVSLMGSVLARQLSIDAGASETIMFRDGFLSEAASSNVWVVKDGMVLGPPADNLVLKGIRYGLIETICKAQGLPFALRRIHRDEVLAADELLLSSASKEVLAVTTLDAKPVASGLPGPIYHALYAGYQALKKHSAQASVTG